MIRGAVAGLALAVSGCAGLDGGAGVALSGGLHDILERGVHVTILTIPAERLWAPPRPFGKSE